MTPMRTNETTYLPGLKKLLEGKVVSYHAERLGIDSSSLSQYKNCKRGVSLAMALKIAKYFGTTVEKLTESHNLAAV